MGPAAPSESANGGSKEVQRGISANVESGQVEAVSLVCAARGGVRWSIERRAGEDGVCDGQTEEWGHLNLLGDDRNGGFAQHHGRLMR